MLYKNSVASIIVSCALISMISNAMFPGSEIDGMRIPFEYYAPTQTEKDTLTIVGEGCFTCLEKEGNCALIGPLKPCQEIELTNREKTIVTHLSYEVNILSFCKAAKEYFAGYDLSETKGLIFTTTMHNYDSCVDFYGKPWVSYQKRHQGRTQYQVLVENKNLLIDQFNIANPGNITLYKFNSPEEEPLNDYLFADVYVFLKYSNKTIQRYSTCPMAENIFDNLSNLPFEKRVEMFSAVQMNIHRNNPFIQQPIVTKNTYAECSVVEI